MNGSVNTRIIRFAAWIWLLYQVCQVVVDSVIYINRDLTPVLWYHMVNLLPTLIFLALAYLLTNEKYSNVLTPLLILLISVVPLVVNRLLDMRLPPAPLSNLEGMVLRQLPVLMISLILVAWHYDLFVMISYSIVINLFDLLLVTFTTNLDSDRISALFFVVAIRTISFIVVGLFINLLIQTLRSQQRSLKLANDQLTNYSSTLESLTISRERNRLARELHDTLAHTLTGLSVSLETAQAMFDIDPQKSRELLSRSLKSTRSGIEETRRALKSLRASPLDDLGLKLAISEMAESASARCGFSLKLNLPVKMPAVRPEVEQCLFRVVQEAVENICHHANAKKVKISLAFSEKICRLSILDDGIGFDTTQPGKPNHYGLMGMRERAQAIGAQLEISSQPGMGSSIELMIRDGKS